MKYPSLSRQIWKLTEIMNMAPVEKKEDCVEKQNKSPRLWPTVPVCPQYCGLSVGIIPLQQTQQTHRCDNDPAGFFCSAQHNQ